MNKNHTITLREERWGIPLRVLSLVNLFLASFALVQCVMILLNEYNLQEVSMPVVFVFLMITPFAFVATLLFAFGIHRIGQGIGADANIIWGFAMMILLEVDNLVYIPIHYEADQATSFFTLGGIELICLIIYFLYYQNMGNRVLTLCAGILLILSFGFEMSEAVRLVMADEVGASIYSIYNLVKKALNTLIAVQAFLFVFAFSRSVTVENDD